VGRPFRDRGECYPQSERTGGPAPQGTRTVGSDRLAGAGRAGLRTDEAAAPPITGGRVVRTAPPVLRPPPTPTRLTIHFPGSPVIGRPAPAAKSAGRRAGEGLPSSRRHYLDVPRPIRRRVPDGCASRLFTASMAFTVISAARLPLLPPSRARPLTTLQASRHAADRPVAPPYRAFDAGLRPRPFPDDTASLLPGLLAATRTGLTPASDDELTNAKNTMALRHGVTSRCAGRTKDRG
jgi:hypothetical protein